MTLDDFRNLFSFMIWGDHQVVAAARSLPEEAYYREQEISAGSVHKLLAHCMGAQWIWLERWRGRSLPARPDDQFTSLQAIEQRWPQIHAELVAFLEQQTPASLAANVSYLDLRGQPVSMPLGEQMMHVVDHATYHRGQLNTMIRRAGGTPSLIMYWAWVNSGKP